MDIKVGKKYYFYDERAEHSVCVAHVLGVMPHPGLIRVEFSHLFHVNKSKELKIYDI